MKDNTEAKLKGLFDYQRFEQEPHLQGMIDGVKAMGRAVPLDDEELTFAAGGIEEVGTGGSNPNYHWCERCKAFRVFRIWSGGREACPKCNWQPGEPV